MSKRSARAIAPSNIALVKYWGKRDTKLNLPAAGSLSATLSSMYSETEVTFDETLSADQLIINGEAVSGAGLSKAVGLLNDVRRQSGEKHFARVESTNNFPTAAGLASSASGYAALAVAAAAAAGWRASTAQLSALARLGSGSACRSLIGGFAEWQTGSASDGSDSYAIQVAPAEHWPLKMYALVVTEGPKATSSTHGMMHTAASSPYYTAWIDSVARDLNDARAAIASRDFSALSEVAERSCLAMHAAMISARPSLVYWRPQTLAVIEQLKRLRAAGLSFFFTIDAGPHVKVFVPPETDPMVEGKLAELDGVRRVISAVVGPGARVVD
ncbi:MAG: diphosphomevalonate decarboxylase [Deltaproteobacteria bacterium]|nr:diphosphomevalonate decarboxylase [Deltaproteobacteria bacterium]